MNRTTIPARAEVNPADCWDLSSLYASDEQWETDLARFALFEGRFAPFKGALAAGDSGSRDALLDCLALLEEAQRLLERLYVYASLRKSADESDAANLDRLGRVSMAATAFDAATSWIEPTLLSLDAKEVSAWAEGDARFGPYRVWIEKRLRMKPHVLSEGEERVLALEAEGKRTPSLAFSALTNVDIDFGLVETAEGPRPLSQTSFSQFLESPDRAVRERAYRSFYGAFDRHRNTIASLYAGSVNQDVAEARIRGYPSARAMALFPDRVGEEVYDNLVSTVRANLAPLHRYYDLRRRALGLGTLRHWDVYVPLVPGVKRVTPSAEACDLVADALKPLGGEYVDTIRAGLLSGWVDRYENKGKRSGAFSSGAYVGSPYILMNYKEDVLRDVFTLAHEGGHSMHTLYAARSNPFLCYDYTIFEAEVASTFNEDLLFRHFIKGNADPALRAYLLSTRASDILATLYRQTMFAEFERTSHALVEAGTPLTADLLRAEYRKLLEAYFGPGMELEAESDLEGLRIPHFYHAFYVYKYATGISASLALAERVSAGGASEREDYFKFLSSGGSRYPIDALRVAGVDMSKAEPVERACRAFGELVDELARALDELGSVRT